MKTFILSGLAISISMAFGQASLPINFETPVTVDAFDNAVGSVVANPSVMGINTSANVGKLVRPSNITSNWAGSRIVLAAPLNFSTTPILAVKVYSTQPAGYNIICKFEGGTPIESSAITTVSGQWETIYFNFTGQSAGTNNQMLFMFNAGAPGNGEQYFFDDIQSLTSIPQGSVIELPINFESPITVGDFDGAVGARVANPFPGGINTSGYVGQLTRPAGGPYAGSRITLTAPINFSVNSILSMKVYCTQPIGHPILVKFEGGTPVEVSAVTTKTGEWETLEFDFTGLVGGTNNQMLFMFNFGTVGSGEVYYFDDIQLGDGTNVGLQNQTDQSLNQLSVFPNPSTNVWTISNENQTAFTCQISDLSGKFLGEFNSGMQQSLLIDASNFPSGIYILEVVSDNQKQIFKLMKD